MNRKAIFSVVLPAIVLLTGLGPMEEESRKESIQLAISTLSEKFKAPASEFEMLSAEPVDWSGDRPGCRPVAEAEQEPIRTGYRVRLGRAGSVFAVHVGGGKAVICDFGPATESVSDPQIDPELDDLVEEAKLNLAERLAVPVEVVKVIEAVPVVWRDSSAGCPNPKRDYLQVLTPGTRIRLQVSKRIYQYHSARDGAPFLCKRPSPTKPLPVSVK